ncbi:nucleoside phosphorylase [Flavobacteriaceae bacterium F89]|uniref:Uridine phosphorylase n=1 Tax=Cerina litoralis TaxID=2874477 RepID=A0AAE3EXC8_9FLAO|nr:nucleoside phosphorylase [Cerina litoralis]MCG2461316.1 nucleoside phosphorylase [Cerina litoralis]
MPLGPSELILNADGSIYHLHLIPEDLANTIITVGDPNRVAKVSSYFDTLEIIKANREFTTHTGILSGNRITVVSTGIGTDNIDIVLNELDALVNIDFGSREVKHDKKQLDIVRIGTAGAIQPQIPVDSFLTSEYALGFDNLMHFYLSDAIQNPEVQEAFIAHMQWSQHKSTPYFVECDRVLAQKFKSHTMLSGLTATNVGFYGPQGRTLRLKPQDEQLNSKLTSFNHKGLQIANLEMETSGIYGLSKLLGHRAVSLNCILANRSTGEFSKDPDKAVDGLIRYALEKLTGV